MELKSQMIIPWQVKRARGLIQLDFKEKALLVKSLGQFHLQVSQVRRIQGRCPQS